MVYLSTSQYWDIPDVFRSDSRRDTRCRVTATTNEDDKWMERNFIILLTRIEQVSPRWLILSNIVTQCQCDLSFRHPFTFQSTASSAISEEKIERRDGTLFFKSSFATIDSSPSSRVAKWFPGIHCVAGSFLRKRGDPDHRIPNIGPIRRSWKIENSVISWMIEILLSITSRSSLVIFFFFEHARTRARYLPGDCPNFFIVAFYSTFYREFTSRRSLMDSRGAALTPVSISSESPEHESYEENFLLMTFWWGITKYCKIYERLLDFFSVFFFFTCYLRY